MAWFTAPGRELFAFGQEAWLEAGKVSWPTRKETIQTTLVVFGNPLAGTPLMEAAQIAGIDLPLKALVWEDADGTVKLSYNDPRWISKRHCLGEAVARSIAGMTALLAALAQRATGN